MRQAAAKAREAAQSTTQTQARTAPANVRLDISHLSVEGYTAAQHARFMRTLEAALRTLAAQPRDWSSLAASGAQHLARVAPLTVRPGSTPEEAARELARRLFARLPAQTTAAIADTAATERRHA